MTPQSGPDLTAYLNELFRTNSPEQQNNTFWIPTPNNPGKSEDHTPVQTRTLKQLIGRKEKEKLYPQESTECPTKFFKRFHWTEALLTKTKKQAN